MRRLLLLIVSLLGCTVVASGQAMFSEAREAEWKSYVLPKTNFARQVTPGNELLFRVPVDWKQEGTDLIFNGPHSARIFVNVGKIPDGYPFHQYFASVLQGIKDIPGAVELTLTRKTRFQDLEAREICLDLPNEEGEMMRRVVWITTNGPLAISFHFQVPTAHTAETEPYFKAVVQSMTLIDQDVYPTFDRLRASLLKTPSPGPVHEIESIVETLNDLGNNREGAITRLASLLATNTDVAIDLILDRRPFVRAAVVRALAQSNNSAFTPFLWQMVDDHELVVAEVAARSVANTPDVVAQVIKHSLSGFDTETIARVWPFMSKEKRNELLQRIFAKPAVRTGPAPVIRSNRKSGVDVVVTELAPVKPGEVPPDPALATATDPNVQIGALTLLSTLPREHFKLPLAQILASKYDPLTTVALQAAHYRGESLPLDALLKLVASSDQSVSKLAAQSLAISATASDIPKIEALISKDASSAKKGLDDELKRSIRRIRFRQELADAKNPDELRAIIRKALSDPSIADFAWRFDCEATIQGCAPATNTLKTDFVVKPFAENLFPKNVRHYAAIPNPGQAVQRFYETLNGLQLETPRAQANLVLTMGVLRQALMHELSAPPDAATLIEYTGIDPNSPIALTSWTAPGAQDGTSGVERKAIVLRVKDRLRFERAIGKYQKAIGGFTDLTGYVAVGTRAIAALPAILPVSVQALQSFDPTKKTTRTVLNYALSSDSEWNGLRIKTIEHRWLNSDWTLLAATTHLTFIGDVAIVTPDFATLRELLANANNQTAAQSLADNEAYRKAVQSKGDIVYFSDLNSLLGELTVSTKDTDVKISESGSLNVEAASWENSHHLVFEESDWAKPLLPFHPKELTAPSQLLPASTIAYYLMKVDAASLWPSKLRTAFLGESSAAASAVWAIDLEKEVLPELGPECGAVLLELPNRDFSSGAWAAFCKLKSNKLADALSAGKLFTGVGAAKDFAEVKVESSSYFVATRAGFLVVSNSANVIAAFDGKTNLAASRDYSRAVEKVPGGIVAFGGYNLEAAIAAVNQKPIEGMPAEAAKILTSVASAFHSQNFYATATAGTVEARSSVAMDREGRYPIADFSMLPRGTNITFVTLAPTGVPISDQKRLSSLAVSIRAKAPGPIDNIKDDIKTAEQSVEQRSPKELLVTVAARRGNADTTVQLPVKDPQFAEFLKATTEFAANDNSVIEQARKIAGDDKDAWSVARKLADWTYQNLEWRLVAAASAGQTLATREADCSEFSELYVAMARSLGLPSRMVSGLAYSGNSFGGHAWVEVWVGKWIELDPTWGTHFVDATHIRNNSNSLVTSAALNLIELEVVETKRTVSDFQKNSRVLGQHLLKAIAEGNESEVEAALDLPVLADEFMGQGAWSKMNDAERERMWSAYRRVLFEIVQGYGPEGGVPNQLRMLHFEEKDNVANVTCLLSPAELLLKLRLVRRNDVWYLAEVVATDDAFHTVHETLRPAIGSIEKARAGQKAVPAGFSDHGRVMLLRQKDQAKALAVAEEALKANPGDLGLRYLKAMALLELDKDDESEELLRELVNENFPTAIYSLADLLTQSEDADRIKEGIALYERYTTFEPHDPRAYSELAFAYDDADDLVKAEAALRKVVELNPTAASGYQELVMFLARHERSSDVTPVLAAADKNKDTDDDVFGNAVGDLYFMDENQAAAKLATSAPARLKTSAMANLYLGRVHFDDGKYALALNTLNVAAQLDKTDTSPHVIMAQVHRKQSRWAAALKAAQHAISLDEKYSEGHYQRACALARMGRIKEAMASLEKAVELDAFQAEYAAKEEDLKPLAALPAFKKLLPKPEEPEPEKP